jgi:ankyrin repeat protein
MALLLERKADLEALDHTDFTPLHYAVYYNYPGAVQWLLAHGANINATSADCHYNEYHYRKTPYTMAQAMQADSHTNKSYDRTEILKIFDEYNKLPTKKVNSSEAKDQEEKANKTNEQKTAVEESKDDNTQKLTLDNIISLSNILIKMRSMEEEIKSLKLTVARLEKAVSQNNTTSDKSTANYALTQHGMWKSQSAQLLCSSTSSSTSTTTLSSNDSSQTQNTSTTTTIRQ